MRRQLLAAGEVVVGGTPGANASEGPGDPRSGSSNHGPCRGMCVSTQVCLCGCWECVWCVCMRVHRGAGVDRGCACVQYAVAPRARWPRVEGPLWEPAVCTAMPWLAREAAASWGSSGEAEPRAVPRDPQAVRSLRPRLAGASRRAAQLRGLWVTLQARCWVWLGGSTPSSSSRRPGVPGGRMTPSDASGDGGSIGACTSGAPSPLCSRSVGRWAAEFPDGPWGLGRCLAGSAAGPGRRPHPAVERLLLHAGGPSARSPSRPILDPQTTSGSAGPPVRPVPSGLLRNHRAVWEKTPGR
ncbi:unnamed protein product [Rangifer tarandus platyrhynchus]|uniref:Uncharacterized protein n=1 Tax=Rangifer tarandus platyrhynchus TaxID=3082113 RepID=A0AC59ZML1_RANTA